ncbi:flagellar assembly protein FliW [Brevibacillus fortis]|uniref:flagellar assembly protein FliW n=1 Tax=Brevibacillus fortis TaxID=2126352 RepID=UPI002E20A96B|nr:flagellar assembly protein FliW [Brevibacillus fortis]
MKKTASHVPEIGKVYFEEGIPGFSHLQFFQLMQEEAGTPFYLLQSMEDNSVAFWVVEPFELFTDYQFELKAQVTKDLRLADDTSLVVLNIVTSRQGSITANLKAPIVINIENRMAKQVILDEDFEVQHSFLKKSAKPGGG